MSVNSSNQSIATHPARLALFALGIAAAPALAAPSHVPPIVVTASTTLFSNGTTSLGPGQVAIDKAGNVFYISHVSPYTLFEIPASAPAVTTTAPVPLITGMGAYNSNGVFVDPKGNLWVANGNGSATVAGSTEYIGLLEIPALNGIPNTAAVPAGGETVAALAAANCSATQTMPCVWQDNAFATNLTGYYVQPSSLFVDGSGNVYFVDYYDNNSTTKNRIVMFNTASPSTGTLLASGLTQNNAATLALDGAGKLYYADSPTNGGNGNVSLVSGGVLTTVGNAPTLSNALITSATGVSADSYGNLYISSSTQISEVPFESGAAGFADEFGIVSGLTNSIVYGGNVDSNGNYYYASYTNIQQVQINGYNFGSIPVGTLVSSTAPSLTLYFNAAEAGVSSYFPTGSPTSNTNPAFLQSFPFSGTKSFTGGTSFTAGQTATITMDFQPVHAGLLKGSYTPRSGGANDAIINLQGLGVGPQVTFLPGIASTVFTSAAASSTSTTQINLNGPQGLAVDTYGDIFVADTGNGKVVADCLATTTAAVSGTGTGGTSNSFCGNTGYLGAVVELGTGFTKPAGVALDGANNLYVVDSTANTVTQIQGVNLTSAILVAAADTFGGIALSSPQAIAVDGYTNVYIADTGNNRIVKAHQFGAAASDDVVYIPSTTTFGGVALSSPAGLGLDAAGDLFIADRGNNRIVEYSVFGVTSIVTTTGVTLNAPTGVTVLPSGTLVVTDSANGISLIANGAGSALPIGSLAPHAPQGIALDLAGNLYVGDTAGNRVLELNTSSPTLVAFASTQATTMSANNTTTVVNGGNSALAMSAAPALDSGDNNFTIVASTTCTGTSSVAKGANCTVVTAFKPQTPASFTGSVTLTDNQLAYTLNTTNASASEQGTYATTGTQTIALSGTGLPAPGIPQTIIFPAPSTPVTYGSVSTVTLSATGGASGNPVVFSVLTGPATVSGSTLTITGAGTIVVAADQAGNGTYSQASEVTNTIVVKQAAQTITFTPPASPIGYTTTPITLSATGGPSGNPVVFSVISGPGTISGTSLTVTGVGTIVVAANQAASTNYAAATQVTQSIVVNPAAQTINFTAPPSPISYTTTPIALTATSSSGLAVTFSIVSGPGTISAGAVTVTGLGSIVIAANQAGNATYAAAPQVTQTIVVNPLGTVATPVTSLVAGTYNGTQAVFLSDTTAGATIYYTTNGTMPTTASTVYGGLVTMNGIPVANSETILAIAVEPGYTNSAVASSVYIISTAAATFTYTLTPATLTITHGQTGTINIALAPVNGFIQTINFACTGLPPGASCLFNPTVVTTQPSQAVVNTVLTVTAPPTLSALSERPLSLMSEVALALTFCWFGFRKRRTLRVVLTLLACGIGLSLMSGCGTSTGNNTSQVTVTMAASSVSLPGGSVRQSTNFTLVVQ